MSKSQKTNVDYKMIFFYFEKLVKFENNVNFEENWEFWRKMWILKKNVNFDKNGEFEKKKGEFGKRVNFFNVLKWDFSGAFQTLCSLKLPKDRRIT